MGEKETTFVVREHIGYDTKIPSLSAPAPNIHIRSYALPLLNVI